MRADEAAWYRATTLAERLPAPAAIDAIGADDARTAFRLEAWKSQRPFDRMRFFESRLALDRLSETELRELLAEPPNAIRRRLPAPPWLAELTAALASPASSQGSRIGDLLPDSERIRPSSRFAAIADPIVTPALDRLARGSADLARRTSCRLFEPAEVPRLFIRPLVEHVLTMVTRVMVLEMHIARLEGALDAATPEARFEQFVERIRRPDQAEALLREYPVLARCLHDASIRWVEATLEMLERLAADESLLQAAFGGASALGRLANVSGGLSDPRHGGRAVAILRFRSGARVVYKPKSLAIDLHFQQLVEWVNGRGFHPALSTLRVLDCGAYGWSECARPRRCETADEVERFYTRQGAYLALLYLLEATDFHAGNIIASGEHPVLIDLEALFHPHRSRRDPPSGHDATAAARDALDASVLRIGLLPERDFSSGDEEGVDLSGLGTLDGQITAYGVAQWEGTGTDAMRLVRKRKAIRPDDNRPSLPAGAVNVLDYRRFILDGFSSAYRLLADHRRELVAADGPLARFANDQVCVFLRSARTYRRLLKESYHPDLLRDALDRDRHFDLLWVEVERHPELAEVIASERADLLRGDVPIMLTTPGSRDLWTSGRRFPDFFDEPSLAAARRRLEAMGERDLARQTWIIEASLATLSEDGSDRAAYARTPPVPSPDRGVLRRRLLAAAEGIGDRLGRLALRTGGGASWTGLQSAGDRYWSVDVLGPDVSEGLAGVALFLAYLGAAVDQPRYSALAEAAVATLQHDIAKDRDAVIRLGAFDGWGGIVYALTHLGRLWQRQDLLDSAHAAVDGLPALIDDDDDFDVCNGAAGGILALRQLAQVAPSNALVETARRMGDHLLAHAAGAGPGIGWPSGSSATRPLAGLAHGAAGIAWALLELAAWTGDARFRDAAREALRYERTLFVEAAGNWQHLGERRVAGTEAREETSRLTTTCWHGAPGIALARLRGAALGERDAVIEREVAVALRTTVRDGFGRNHSLGHGDLGNLDVLLQASQLLPHSRWRADLDRLTVAVLTSVEQRGPHGATPFHVMTPGLMTGLAGIGAGLLRLAEPEWMPSFLSLDPPPGRSRVG